MIETLFVCGRCEAEFTIVWDGDKVPHDFVDGESMPLPPTFCSWCWAARQPVRPGHSLGGAGKQITMSLAQLAERIDQAFFTGASSR